MEALGQIKYLDYMAKQETSRYSVNDKPCNVLHPAYNSPLPFLFSFFLKGLANMTQTHNLVVMKMSAFQLSFRAMGT